MVIGGGRWAAGRDPGRPSFRPSLLFSSFLASLGAEKTLEKLVTSLNFFYNLPPNVTFLQFLITRDYTVIHRHVRVQAELSQLFISVLN
jgi:hypothetical protein